MIHVLSILLLRNKTNLNARNKLNLKPFKFKNSLANKFVMLVQVVCSLINVDKTFYTFKEFLSKTTWCNLFWFQPIHRKKPHRRSKNIVKIISKVRKFQQLTILYNLVGPGHSEKVRIHQHIIENNKIFKRKFILLLQLGLNRNLK